MIAETRRCPMTSHRWRIDGPSLWIHPGVRLTFQRIPQVDDASAQPSFRSQGALPLAAAGEDLLLPVSASEAFWIGVYAEARGALLCFRFAVMADSGSIVDALTGEAWLEKLDNSPQNYVVCPPQRAIDGVFGQHGARPFARTTRVPQRHHPCHRMTICVRGPKNRNAAGAASERSRVAQGSPQPMKAIGPIASTTTDVDRKPQILADPLGAEWWDESLCLTLSVELVSFERFEQLTGYVPPASDPASSYGGWRLP